MKQLSTRSDSQPPTHSKAATNQTRRIRTRQKITGHCSRLHDLCVLRLQAAGHDQQRAVASVDTARALSSVGFGTVNRLLLESQSARCAAMFGRAAMRTCGSAQRLCTASQLHSSTVRTSLSPLFSTRSASSLSHSALSASPLTRSHVLAAIAAVSQSAAASSSFSTAASSVSSALSSVSSSSSSSSQPPTAPPSGCR